MLTSYNQVSQHHGSGITSENEQNTQQAQSGNAIANAKRQNDSQNQQQNTASIVRLSFEAQIMQEQAGFIMKDHDLHNISQNELDKLSDHLKESEVISSQEYAVLSFHAEQIFVQDESGSEQIKTHPDQKLNMIEKWQNKLAEHKERKSRPLAIKQTEGIVNLLNNLQVSRDDYLNSPIQRRA